MPRNIRLIIDRTSDFLVNFTLYSILADNMNGNENLRFMIASTDLYGMNKSLELFDTNILFWINVFVRQKLMDYSNYKTLRMTIKLKPFNIMLDNKKEKEKNNYQCKR